MIGCLIFLVHYQVLIYFLILRDLQVNLLPNLKLNKLNIHLLDSQSKVKQHISILKEYLLYPMNRLKYHILVLA